MHTYSMKKKSKYFVYALEIDGLKRYVGRSSSGFNRANHHFYVSNRKKEDGSWLSELPVHRWIRKECKEPVILILEECPLEVEDKDTWLNENEIIWIARLREEGSKLLNCTNGGEGISGYRHTEESKKKIAEASRNQVWTEERKQKISKAVSGEKNGWYGKPSPASGRKMSDEQKEKLRQAQLGIKRPELSGDNHWTSKQSRGPNSGRKFSEEHCDNIGLAKKGKKFPNRKGKSVRCINDGKAYKSQQLAAEAYGLTKQHISRSARLGREYSNLKFEFVESS